MEGSAEDVLAAHRAIAAALDAEPDDAELRRIHRELVDEGAIARLRALERVRAAVGRLADAGPVSEIIDRAPAEAAAALELDRVLLSRIDDGWLVAEALHCEGDAKAAAQTLARLREAPVQIGYPLIEGELLRRRRAAVVTAADGEPESRQANWEIMRWSAYVVAPVLMEGRVVGFLHGDRADGGAPLRAVEREGLWRFGEGFSEVYERAVLRRRLRVERQELRRIASWADGRSAELSDGAIDLARDRQLADAEEARPAARGALGAARPADPARARRARAPRQGRDQRRDRPHAHRLRGHGQVPRQEHPAQDERRQPGRGDLAVSAPLPASRRLRGCRRRPARCGALEE